MWHMPITCLFHAFCFHNSLARFYYDPPNPRLKWHIKGEGPQALALRGDHQTRREFRMFPQVASAGYFWDSLVKTYQILVTVLGWWATQIYRMYRYLGGANHDEQMRKTFICFRSKCEQLLGGGWARLPDTLESSKEQTLFEQRSPGSGW